MPHVIYGNVGQTQSFVVIVRGYVTMVINKQVLPIPVFYILVVIQFRYLYNNYTMPVLCE